jgi:hypothetical protein
MSTRVHTLTFTPAQTQVLPQGRYWLIKSAASALDLEMVKRNGQPNRVENVGAGTKFNGLDTDRWYELKITSAAAQVVEIVIADESTVDFTNAVSVTGTAATAELPSATISTPARQTRATGGATTIAANPLRRRITIANPSDNATPGLLYVQAVGAGAGRGIPLDSGLFLELRTTAAIDIRNDSGASVDFTTFEES